MSSKKRQSKTVKPLGSCNVKKESAKKSPDGVLWAGRLTEKPEGAAFVFQASIPVDKRLVYDDITGSRAHVVMLGKQGIIPERSAAALDRELARIEAELRSGKLVIDESYEDVHSFVEAVLTARLGDEGRMVHAGRSRNDQVALDLRLYLKRKVPELCSEIRETILTLLTQAEKYSGAVMPGYTHLQRAQPVTLGHHLCAWASALQRDLSRFAGAQTRLDECPLGAGALAGSGLPLDRKAVAAALGFSRPCLNSMDAVAGRDFALELAAASAILMINLSRFCEDVVLWASEEFRYIDLPESWSTGSSIMPQKKNPDFAELIRGKSGRTAGNLAALLTLLKGLPYAYNKDLQEDKEALFDSLDTVSSCLEMFRGMMASSSFNTARMKAACVGGFMEATDAAEYLVRKGLPFRKAHEAAALIVRECIEAGKKTIADFTLEELKKHSDLFEKDIFTCLTPKACVEARSSIGGPAPAEVRRQIKVFRKMIG